MTEQGEGPTLANHPILPSLEVLKEVYQDVRRKLYDKEQHARQVREDLALLEAEIAALEGHEDSIEKAFHILAGTDIPRPILSESVDSEYQPPPGF